MNNADPRHIALDVLLRVESGAFSDLALDAALNADKNLDPRDRALATELVYGILRRRGSLDFALRRFCNQPLAKLETRVLWLLRLGAYQILHLDRIPERAAVHATVELARSQGLERATGFLNGILRSLVRERETIAWPNPQKNPLGALEHTCSLPQWLAKSWLSQFGVAKALALGEAMLAPAPFTLRVNTLRLDREELLAQLHAAGHTAEPTAYAPEGIRLTGRAATSLPGDREGWYQVQDEASMLIPHLLDPQAGERILDACAAPGGKATQIAALTGNRAQILALDLHPQRLDMVDYGARRLGAEGIETSACDLSRPPSFLEPASFDRILVDAPCSGLGVLRRNPEVRWRRQPEEVRELATLQRTILAHIAPLLRPDGLLLYSLCTITAEETTGVLAAFLAAHPDFAIEDGRESFPPHWHELFDEQGILRTYPHRHGGMDAFFAVRLRKKG